MLQFKSKRNREEDWTLCTMLFVLRRMHADCRDGVLAAFPVGAETFRAHRAVVTAPVFRTQLLGGVRERLRVHHIQQVLNPKRRSREFGSQVGVIYIISADPLRGLFRPISTDSIVFYERE